jgi:lipopolysaccharide/colanic/teichoic acid biosynthesis glycosyltransferase
MALIAIAVRLSSPGPVLFRQQRLGKKGVVFPFYKFRSMVVNAPDIRNADGSTFNADNDPRVTRVGRLLRKTSLDELPQLISVLKGDMSLVGPRPDVADALRIYRPQDYIRLTVKPGITGWAAIHGRNTVPLDQRRDLDIEYVTKYSLRLDIEILLRTIPYVLASRGVNTYSASGENPDV